MFEIKEITRYETEDGKSFETYEEAEKHNKTLIEKEVPFDEFSMYNVYGEPVPVERMNDYDYVWYIYAKTDNGARFLERFIGEHSSLEEFIHVKPKTLYRYDGDYGCWVSQEEDLNRFNSYWANLITFEEARC